MADTDPNKSANNRTNGHHAAPPSNEPKKHRTAGRRHNKGQKGAPSATATAGGQDIFSSAFRMLGEMEEKRRQMWRDAGAALKNTISTGASSFGPGGSPPVTRSDPS